MNIEILVQLAALLSIVVAGPLIVVLLYARSGNL